MLKKLSLVAVLLFKTVSPAFADVALQNYLVLGVIASSKDAAGIALLKNISSGKTIAIKSGQSIDGETTLKKVNGKSIEVEVNSVAYLVDVGGELASASVMSRTPNTASSQSFVQDVSSAVEVQGNTVKVSESYKNQLVNVDLQKILMQAAAVPHLVDGRLAGFQLWEIERDSVFDVAGFKDGDIVTKINGQPIKDVSMAVRLLTSLKNLPEAKFDYLRNGAEQNITVVVQ